MKHHAFATAMGLLTAAVLIPGSQAHASTADPTGYWMKIGAERNAKIQVTRCGKGNAQLCSKIVWLENPNDSKGGLLKDVRNENPSLRGRTIQGLPLFTGLTRTGPTTWTGKIYNPEDGNTYAATLTMVSKSQINLKGCKAWLLCGERVWKRTSPPPQEKPIEPEPQIEASVKPDAPPAEAQAAAAALPSVRSSAPQADAVPAAVEPQTEAVPQMAATVPAAELVTPAPAPADHSRQQPGFGFLTVSSSEPTGAELSGENVPSMFLMTGPLEKGEMAPQGTNATVARAVPETETAVPPPQPKPTPAPQATAAATPKPQDAPAKPNPQAMSPAKPSPQADSPEAQAQQAALNAEPETAEDAAEAAPPLTRRERRIMRRQMRQQQPLLPWLR